MKRLNPFLIFVLVAMLSINASAQPPAHDPCNIMKDGDRYWVFKTSNGIRGMWSDSTSFTDWKPAPPVFDKTWPDWIMQYVPDFKGHFWAPSCIFMNNQYYLYYSCSSFGKSTSAIGLVTSPSLNNPVWTDRGMVVSSDGSRDTINAIDPAIFKDDDGSLWMTYGSWFGGIAVIQLNPESGKPIGELHRVAGGNHTDIEAPYLMKHEGYYYLFVNRGLCCKGVNSTYYIEVGRSKSITGPYEDWRRFLETDGSYIGPGHVGYKQDRLTYHIYDKNDNGKPKMLSTTMHWVDGWPIPDAVKQ